MEFGVRTKCGWGEPGQSQDAPKGMRCLRSQGPCSDAVSQSTVVHPGSLADLRALEALWFSGT